MTDNKIQRVYVAGAYNADNVISVLGNMRRGMDLSYKVLKEGFSPFCPWLDYHFSLIGEVSINEYYKFSMDWLRVSDAVLVVPEGVENSKGTQAELEEAKRLGIPIFFDLESLMEYNNNE